MTGWLVQIITAAVGTAGFALIFRVHRRRIVPAALVGMLSWGVYLFSFSCSESIVASSVIAAAFAGICAGVLSFVMRCPSNVFLIPGIIPLLPGGALYCTMSAVLKKDQQVFAAKGMETVSTAFGIAMGILAVQALFLYFREAARGLSKHRVRHESDD